MYRVRFSMTPIIFVAHELFCADPTIEGMEVQVHSPSDYDTYRHSTAPYSTRSLLYYPLVSLPAPHSITLLEDSSPIKKSVLDSITKSLEVLPRQTLFATPMRRRHSVASLSPTPSPTSQPPPTKKPMLQTARETYTPMSPHAFLRRLTGTESQLLVQPPGWEIEDGELWDDLFDSISQEWRANCGDVMDKTFLFDNWVEDFVTLGFRSSLLSAFERISRGLFEKFGREIIYGIMENETVGTIAELLLSGEVEYYSAMKTAATNQGTTTGYQNQGSSQSNDSNVAGGGENTRPDTRPLDAGKMEKDDDEGQEEKHPHANQTECDGQNSVVYPAWLHRLHELAQTKSIQLMFSDTDITQSEQGRYLSPFIEWIDSISQSTTPAYHGCDIPPRLLINYVTSFLDNGVLALPNRRGYFSVTPAAYYTNSLAYARVWPVIKSNLRGWRHLDSLPAPSILIVVSEPSVNVVRGESEKFTTTIIPQDRLDVAAQVFPLFSPSLTDEQYATATKTSQAAERVSHENYPSISTCDFIISPLPKHTMDVMQSSRSLGRVIAGHNDISSISILTAATDRAVKYMSQCITKIIILGWGEGNLGASEKVDFGSAGMRNGTSKYD